MHRVRAEVGRVRAGAVALAAALAVSYGTSGRAATPWPVYRHDGDNAGAVYGPRLASVRLAPRWTYRAAATITSTPIVGAGLVYAGTWSGRLVALDRATGRVRWSAALGANPDRTYGGPRGIVSSPALAGNVVYAISGSCVAAAFDARRGTPLWRRRVCSVARNDDTYASPVVAAGLVLFGIDLFNDRPTDRGRLVALDAALGIPRWQLFPERYRGPGTGISATPALDLSAGLGFVGTGNPLPRGAPPPGPDRYAESILAFDLRSGALRWTYGPVHPHDLLDRDLFASPNRFAIEREGLRRWTIGEAGKDDVYYAIDETTGRPAWRRALGGAPYTQVVGTPATAAGRIFVPLYQAAQGAIVALAAQDGRFLWRRALPAGAYEAPAVRGDVVFATDVAGDLFALAAGDGRVLLRRRVGTRLTGRGPSVAGDDLYVAATNALTDYAVTP